MKHLAITLAATITLATLTLTAGLLALAHTIRNLQTDNP